MKCEVCGKDISYVVALCHEHYVPVSAYVEGLKPKRDEPLTWRLEPHGSRPANGTFLGYLYGCEIWYDPDMVCRVHNEWRANHVEPSFLFDSHRWTAEHGKGYKLHGDALCVGDDDKEVELTEAAANALYEQMRRERCPTSSQS
jgi:hypothetical protein